MDSGKLSQYFEKAAVKKISNVEVNPAGSHQHEFNVPRALKNILGTEQRYIKSTMLYLDPEEGTELCKVVLDLKYYDSRENHPIRSEYRLYYPDNIVLSQTNPGDLIVFAKKKLVDELLCIVIPAGHSQEKHILQLFGVNEAAAETETGISIVFAGDADKAVQYVEALILEELGINVQETEIDRLDTILKDLNGIFPSTKAFSNLALKNLPHINAVEDPDDTLYQLLTFEEKLFRRLERREIIERLNSGFFIEGEPDVDGFSKYSLSFQNRRKSRAGHSLENHLAYIFLQNELRFGHGIITENRQKPDFIFPGKAEYDNLLFPKEKLTMLAAKTSIKERWGQIIKEANRIGIKHLATVNHQIPDLQIQEIKTQNVKLVLPQAIFSYFKEDVRSEFMNIAGFIHHVKSLQEPRRATAE